MIDGMSSGWPCCSRIGAKLLGVRGDAGRGRERDRRELAIRTRVNLEDRGGERS